MHCTEYDNRHNTDAVAVLQCTQTEIVKHNVVVFHSKPMCYTEYANRHDTDEIAIVLITPTDTHTD